MGAYVYYRFRLYSLRAISLAQALWKYYPDDAFPPYNKASTAIRKIKIGKIMEYVTKNIISNYIIMFILYLLFSITMLIIS